MLRALLVMALLGAAGFGTYFYWDGLVPPAGEEPGLRGTPTRLLDGRVPGFALPGLLGPGIAARDLINGRRTVLVTFWGAWSQACIQELPILLELQASGVQLWGIAFRDTRYDVLEYLERNGNPYARLALDEAGRAAADWGVRDVPSTFLVDGDGIVRWHHAGPLTSRVVANQLRPLLEAMGP